MLTITIAAKTIESMTRAALFVHPVVKGRRPMAEGANSWLNWIPMYRISSTIVALGFKGAVVEGEVIDHGQDSQQGITEPDPGLSPHPDQSCSDTSAGSEDKEVEQDEVADDEPRLLVGAQRQAEAQH